MDVDAARDRDHHLRVPRRLRNAPWLLVSFALFLVGIFWRDMQLDALQKGGRAWAPVTCRLPLPAEDPVPLCYDFDTVEKSGDLTPVRVHVVVFDGRRDGLPVYVLNGGPGVRGASYVPFLDAATRRARFGARPVVYVEPRGVGASRSHLVCASAPLSSCLLALRARDVDPTAYGLAAMADDVAGIAAGLRHETIAVAGGSFGSRWAQEVLRRHPDLLAGVFLESVVAPDVAYLQPYVSGTRDAFDELAASCEAQGCGMDIWTALSDGFSGLSEAPLVTSDGEIDAEVWWGAVMNALFHQDLVPTLPRALRALQSRDSESVGRWLRMVLRRSPDLDAFVHQLLLCQEVAPQFDATDFERRLRTLPPPLHASMTRLADALACPTGLDGAPATLVRNPGKTPIRILAPTLDNRTPPENAERVAASASAELIRLPGRTHTPALGFQYGGTAFRDACAEQLLREFLQALDNGEKPPAAPECAARSPLEDALTTAEAAKTRSR